MELKGKTAAILGGGGGIGREIALALVAEGASVIVGDIDEGAARETAAMVKNGITAAHCDLADDNSVGAFADTAFKTHGRVDLLFNHAGTSLGGLLEQVTSDDWNWMLNINLTGLGRSISSFLPRMTAQGGGGWIVNTSSGLGLFHDLPIAGPYIASKAGIIAYSRALSTYVMNRSIGVSVFCPDITATPFMGSGRIKGIPPELLAAGMPIDRLQSPQQAAKTLIEGLKEERFLISAVPETAEKLLAMAKADLTPGSDTFDADGQSKLVLAKGGLRLPDVAREDILALFNDFAEKTRKEHKGCRFYDIAVDPVDSNKLVIYEAWESRAAADAHGMAPESMEFIGKLFKLGASDFSVTDL